MPEFTRLSAILVVAAACVMPLAPAAAAEDGEIVIFRDVPTRNAVLPAPPGQATAIDTSPDDIVRSNVPNATLLSDDQVGDVIASTPETIGGSQFDPQLLTTNGGASSDATSGVVAQGMTSFSSLGGQISGEVIGTVGTAMKAMNSALGVGGN
jgi:hypothetical protein